MTGEQKMVNVHAQVRAIREGRTNVLNCPYCGEQLKAGDNFCCKLLKEAAEASIDRCDVEDVQAHVERVMEKASRN